MTDVADTPAGETDPADDAAVAPDPKPVKDRHQTGEPVRMGYSLFPASRKGRAAFATLYVVLMLVAVAIVGRGPTSEVRIDGTQVRFIQAGPDSALPTAGDLGAWAYTGGEWSVDQGAVGDATEAGVTFATLTPDPGASVEATMETLADGAGVVFRYQDPTNYWGVRAVPSYGGWHIFKVVDGRETILRVLVGQALDGTTVGIQQSGTRFRVVLNGLVRSRIDDEALADAPGVGLMAPAGDDAARFEDVTVGEFDGRIAMRSGDDEQQDEIVPSLNPGGT